MSKWGVARERACGVTAGGKAKGSHAECEIYIYIYRAREREREHVQNWLEYTRRLVSGLGYRIERARDTAKSARAGGKRLARLFLIFKI